MFLAYPEKHSRFVKDCQEQSHQSIKMSHQKLKKLYIKFRWLVTKKHSVHYRLKNCTKILGRCLSLTFLKRTHTRHGDKLFGYWDAYQLCHQNIEGFWFLAAIATESDTAWAPPQACWRPTQNMISQHVSDNGVTRRHWNLNQSMGSEWWRK